MKETAKERLISRFVRIGKENKWKQLLLLPVYLIALFFLNIGNYIFSNGKKYVCIVVVFLFFMMSNSFSFPIFEDMELSGETMVFVEDTRSASPEAAQEMTGASETEEIEFLDDEDVLDGYEDEALESIEGVDAYTLDEILAETDEAHSDLVQSTKSEGDLEDLVFDKNDWRILLINKQHPIPDDYTFELGTIKGAMKCDSRIIPDLFAMLQAAKRDGVNLVICSPYRDMSRQETLFGRKIKAYMGKGMSYMEAYKISSQAVTVPGASEHQVGLALDIVCDNYAALNDGFGDTEAGKWLAEHSYEYGFTLRYPKGKEYITSIEYEPWHFRYVGKDAATVMHEKGICLEEFIDSL